MEGSHFRGRFLSLALLAGTTLQACSTPKQAPGRADNGVVPTGPGRADNGVVPTAPGRADSGVVPTALERIPGSVEVVKLDVAPALDGKLDDSCWKDAVRLADFTGKDGGRPRAGSHAFVFYDDANLYVGVRCQEPLVEKMRRDHTGYDDPVWKDDCIELFIDADLDRTSYYHLIANTVGGRQDAFNKRKKDPTGRYWDFPWDAAAHVGGDFWSIEFAVPFSTLNLPPKAANDIGFTVCRSRYVKRTPADKPEFSAWHRWYHEPESLGVLGNIRLSRRSNPLTYRAFGLGEVLMGVNEFSIALSNTLPEEDYVLKLRLSAGDETLDTQERTVRLPEGQGTFTEVKQRYSIPIGRKYKSRYMQLSASLHSDRGGGPALTVAKKFPVLSDTVARIRLDAPCYYGENPTAKATVQTFLSRIALQEETVLGITLTDRQGRQVYAERDLQMTSRIMTLDVPIQELSAGWYDLEATLSSRATKETIARSRRVLRKVEGPFDS